MELDDLALAAQAGDPRALDDLLARCRPVIMRTCSGMLPCHQDAEDACQETMPAVAANCSRAAYGSLKQRSTELGTGDLRERPDPHTTSVIAGTRIDLLDALEDLERRHPLWVEALVLRDLGDLSYDEIAATLGVPAGTARSRVHDARVRLRVTLG